MKKVVCFGEILWDNFPAGRQPGGAPLNVCYHLTRLGMDATLISSVGDDEDGRQILQFLHEKSMILDGIQMDKKNQTGQVNVQVHPKGSTTYDILYPVAWDFIQLTDHGVAMVTAADVLIYGSLSSRNDMSRNTLKRLLDIASYKVMDVNLRYPYYKKEETMSLLQQADLLKVNEEELTVIQAWLGLEKQSEQMMAEKFLRFFKLEELIVTKGSHGASYYNDKENIKIPAPEIKIADTVGSGDSFLAGFLSQKLAGAGNFDSMKYAVSLAALVTTKVGACPEYEPKDVVQFIN